MSIAFPAAYETQMRTLLGDAEYAAYVQSFEASVKTGLRVNTLKLSGPDFLKRRGLSLRQVPWCDGGYYYDDPTTDFSKHPDYHAGLYYLQEPSAMAPAQVLPVAPGDKVLDLCAAPGGKSTALLQKLGGTGLLVSNDISASRARALLKNLELFGARNAFVTSETPYKLGMRFPGFFHKILVDAPCSGEGMFHKEPEIMKNWAQYGNEYYARLQREILGFAYEMLQPGGYLLYSTCTFHPMEDEGQIQTFLSAHPDMVLEDLHAGGAYPFARGLTELPALGLSNFPEGRRCARLYPHRLEGQGHFLALMKKAPEGAESLRPAETPALSEKGAAVKSRQNEIAPSGGQSRRTGKSRQTDYSMEELTCWESFAKALFSKPWQEILGQGILYKLGSSFYLCPPELSEKDLERFSGLRILRGGLLLGELKKDRFEPSQALAMALKETDVKCSLSFAMEDEQLTRYLRGESLLSEAEGYVLILDQGHPVGFAKGAQGRLKNKLLKGWITN